MVTWNPMVTQMLTKIAHIRGKRGSNILTFAPLSLLFSIGCFHFVPSMHIRQQMLRHNIIQWKNMKTTQHTPSAFTHSLTQNDEQKELLKQSNANCNRILHELVERKHSPLFGCIQSKTV